MFGVSSRYADKLIIGDELLVQGNNDLTPGKVISVSIKMMQGIIFYYLNLNMIYLVLHCSIETDVPFVGAYVPLTTNGIIVVDGVLTSCFAESHHDLAYLIMQPMQQFSEVLDWIFGIDAGFPVFVSSVWQLGKLLVPESQYWKN